MSVAVDKLLPQTETIEDLFLLIVDALLDNKVEEMTSIDGEKITVSEFNEHHDKLGRFASGGNMLGNSVVSDDEMVSAYNSVDSIWEEHKQAAVMNLVAERLGYADKPNVLSSEAYDNLSDEEFYKYYRGIREQDANGQVLETDTLKQSFLFGKYRSGSGDTGSGNYATESQSYAHGYAEQLINGEYEHPILRIAIPKSAKLVERGEAWRLADKARAKVEKKYGDSIFTQMASKGGALYSISKDPGIVAALAGYDGIFVGHGAGENIINFSNRSIVSADENYYDAVFE